MGDHGGAQRNGMTEGAVGFAVQLASWQLRLYYMRDMPSFLDEPNVNMVGLSARFTMDFTRP